MRGPVTLGTALLLLSAGVEALAEPFSESAATVGAGVLSLRGGAFTQVSETYTGGPAPGAIFALSAGISNGIQLDARLSVGGLDTTSPALTLCIADRWVDCLTAPQVSEQRTLSLHGRLALLEAAEGVFALGFEAGFGHRHRSVSDLAPRAIEQTVHPAVEEDIFFGAGPIVSAQLDSLLFFSRGGAVLRAPLDRRPTSAAPYGALGLEYSIAIGGPFAVAPYLEAGLSGDDRLMISVSGGLSLATDLDPSR